MGFAITTPAQKRYVVRSLWCSVLCLAFAYGGKLAIRLYHPSTAAAWLIGAVAALPILGALAVTAAYLREEKDEFQLTIFVQSLLAGIGLTLAVTTVSGDSSKTSRVPRIFTPSGSMPSSGSLPCYASRFLRQSTSGPTTMNLGTTDEEPSPGIARGTQLVAG